MEGAEDSQSNCDFCSDVIPEGEGDPIQLANIEYSPEAALDGCDACVAIWLPTPTNVAM